MTGKDCIINWKCTKKINNILSATTEVLALYIDLNLRKVAEFEEEKSKAIMGRF